MKEQFANFETSLKLKKLGFDQKCLAYYGMDRRFYPMGTVISPDEIHFGIFNPKYQYKNDLEPLVGAPLYQQTFSWFREKFDIQVHIFVFNSEWYFNGRDIKTDTGYFDEDKGRYATFHEAQIASIEKLIEIASEKIKQ